ERGNHQAWVDCRGSPIKAALSPQDTRTYSLSSVFHRLFGALSCRRALLLGSFDIALEGICPLHQRCADYRVNQCFMTPMSFHVPKSKKMITVAMTILIAIRVPAIPIRF